MSLYLISDTHFDHGNIIKYCDRPFDSASEMDEVMRENWNERVEYGDTVLFGGDLAMASGATAIEYFETLRGQLVLLDGNHDDIPENKAPFPILKSYYFTYTYEGEGYEFYYTHWPIGPQYQEEDNWPHYAEPPDWFDGWYLHGHTHNNNVDKFPFVNPSEKFVNLSVELLEYTPIEIEELIPILEQGGRYEEVSMVPNRVYPF